MTVFKCLCYSSVLLVPLIFVIIGAGNNLNNGALHLIGMCLIRKGTFLLVYSNWKKGHLKKQHLGYSIISMPIASSLE